MSAETRRQDSLRKNKEVWTNILDKTKISIFPSVEHVSGEIININESSESEQRYFLQFAVIPIKKDGILGLIISDPFLRMPDEIYKKYGNFFFVLRKQQCIAILNKMEIDESSTLHFIEDGKSSEAIKDILTKMERIEASDVTLSWRRNEVIISYTILGKNIKKYQDTMGVAFAEKVRISLINLSYENQADKTVDGKFTFRILNEVKEFRLSDVETISGHSIVLRSYQKFKPDMTLNDLGYTERPKEIISKILDKPYGVFLITGPTGSGKTTTIYTVIQEAYKTKNYKIKTIEDPVEVELPGIDQCQINRKGEEKHQITYINILRSFLRQRPDIIVVGEIRDFEVAMSTFEAALTGHKVISTLHTNNIDATFTRLKSTLGISEDRIEDSMSGILSQRLVDKLCSCKVEDKDGFYKANIDGCPTCKNSTKIGYDGQIPAVEVVELDKRDRNWEHQNYLDYYSYKDSANELKELGLIDYPTYKILISL